MGGANGGSSKSRDRKASGAKRDSAGRVLSSGSHGESDRGSGPSYGGGSSSGTSSKPKKRFIWPEELHRDFIAAVLDVGLKNADAGTLVSMLPRHESGTGSVGANVVRSTLQKMRSFRYQMRKAHGGDSLETAEEMAVKGLSIGPQGTLLQQDVTALAHLAGGAAAAVRGRPEDMLRIPDEVQRAIDRVDDQQCKQGVELVAQCVQVQDSLLRVLKDALEKQRRLQHIITRKAASLGLPYAVVGALPGVAGGLEADSWGDGVKREPVAYASPRGLAGSTNVGVAGLAAAVAVLDSVAEEMQPSAGGQGASGNASGAGGGTSLGQAVGLRSPGGMFDALALGGGASSGGDGMGLSRSLDDAMEEAVAAMADGGDTDGQGGMSAATAAPAAAAAAATPTEAVLELEMQSHMDFHRRMMLRQQDQLQLHAAIQAASIGGGGGSSSSGGPAPAPAGADEPVAEGAAPDADAAATAASAFSFGSGFNWEDANLDDQLFTFLLDEAPDQSKADSHA